MNMNKKRISYVVLAGDDRFNPELHYKAARHTYAHISEARQFAADYSNAHIFKFQFAKEGHVLEVREII